MTPEKQGPSSLLQLLHLFQGMPATPAPSCLHPWVLPSCPSSTGLARFLVPLWGLKGSVYRCPQLLLSLWERDIWLKGEEQNRCGCQGGLSSRAKGQRHPFFKRQELPAFWAAHFSIVSGPLENQPWRNAAGQEAGIQLPYTIAVRQEERDPQRSQVCNGASFEIKTNIDKS